MSIFARPIGTWCRVAASKERHQLTVRLSQGADSGQMVVTDTTPSRSLFKVAALVEEYAADLDLTIDDLDGTVRTKNDLERRRVPAG